MPRKRAPARLWLRPDTRTWVIKDGNARISTECPEHDIGAAQERLAAHLAAKYEPQRGGAAAKVTIGDVLLVYLQERSDRTARPKETEAMIGRLNAFWGGMTVSQIKGLSCRDYAKHRGNEGGARRDLEVLRAAVNYYAAEYDLDYIPKVTLPKKGEPRQRWLTRQEAAALIRAARRTPQHRHIIRLIIIGLYTGTRLGAILDLQWIANTAGGYVNLETGVMYRKADGEKAAHNKRRTPVKMPRRLIRFLTYWKAKDQGLRYVVHYGGESIDKPHKAFRAVRKVAGLDGSVTPHVLRHTRATWLAQANVPAGEAAASLGLTEQEYERTYLHHSPDFQSKAADAY